MKPTVALRSFLFATSSALLAVSSGHAATFYWDNNNTTAGFGSAGGNWAQNSTSGGTSARWKTDFTGVASGSATQTTTNADIFHFGTDLYGLGTGTITVNAAGVTMGDVFYGSASGAVVLSGGPITFGAAKTITVNNASNTISSIISGAATSLTKAGNGTLILTGANNYTGTTVINGGILNLGGGTANGSLASTALSLGGGTFSYTRTGTNAHSFTSGTTINAGASTVSTTVSTNTINLGALTRTAPGGVLSIGNTGTITTTSANTNGILGGWAVFNNGGTVTNWAFSPGSGLDITGGVTYDLSSTLLDSAASYADKNVDVNSSQAPDAAIAANSLRFHAGSAQTLTLQGANTLGSGGILVTNTVGNAATITGGTLAGSASGDLIVHQYNTTNGLTIDSQIVNNGGATALTKAGPGLLTLNNSNTFTGGVFIHGGQLILGNAGAINSSAPNNVIFGGSSTGTLTLNGNNLTVPVLTTGGNAPGSSVIENANAANVTLTVGNASNSSYGGVIRDGTGVGTLALTKNGAGTLTLYGANTYTGGTTISAGTVVANHGAAFGAGQVTVSGSSIVDLSPGITVANDIAVNGALNLRIQMAGTASTITNTFSGVLSGASAITIPNNGNNGVQGIYDFTNTANTFTGNVVLSASGAGDEHFRFASLGDGGNFTFAKNGNRQLITHNGSSNIIFNTRTISIATTMVNGGSTDRQGMDGGGSNPVSMFVNDGTGTVTFNADMVVNNISSNYGVLYFGGTNSGNNTFAGDISDTSGASKFAIGKFGTGKWILSGSNTYEGDTLIAGGTLSVGSIDVAANAQPLGKGAAIQLGAGNGGAAGTLEYTGGAASTDKQVRIGTPLTAAQAAAGSILNNGSGALTFTNSTFNPTSLSYTHPGTGAAVGLAVTAARTLTLGGSYNGSAFNEIQGTIQNNAATGTVAITLSGSKWKLSGNNTYTGGTTLAINGGILAISHASALGTGTVHNATTNSAVSQSTLQLDFTVPVSGPGSSAVDPNVIANNFTFNSQNLLAAGGFANIQNVSGFNRIGGSLTISGTGGTGANIVSDAGHLELAGNLTTTQTGNRAFNFGGAGDGTVSGIISNGTGTVPVTKSGTGTWTLTGANTFTGALSVQNGKVVLAGATNRLNGGTGVPVVLGSGSDSGVLQIGDSGGAFNQTITNLTTSGTGTANAVVGGNATNSALTLTAGVDFTYNGVFGGSGTNENNLNIVKGNSNTATFTGASTYTGFTRVNNGTLVLAGGDDRLPVTTVLQIGVQSGSNSGILQLGDETGAVNQTVSGMQLSSANIGTANAIVGGNSSVSTLTVNNSSTYTYAGALGGAGTNQNNLALTKSGVGQLTLTGTNTYTGDTTVSSGSLIISGAISSTTVTANAYLGGSGTMASATVGGSGSVNPGNSPGILTASATNPTGGLDYNFEMGTAGSIPVWSNATASVNDVFRLTSATPFTASLDGTNIVTLYLAASSLSLGDVFTGGFFTDNNADFLASVSSATFQYFLADAGGAVTYNGNTYTAYTGPLTIDVGTVQVGTANFSGGDVNNGYVTQFSVVPEPGAALLGSIGLLVLLRRRR